MDSSDLVRTDISALEPYTPIYPLEVLAARLGRPPEEIVKLDANENPYGAPAAVKAALADLAYAHIYPDPESRELRGALSKFTGVSSDLLLAGAGADELIDLTVRLLLNPGDRVINCPPTFGMYAFDAAIAGASVVGVPRHPDFGLDVEGICRATTKLRPKLLFLTSPNNPDGGWLPDAELERLLALPLVVVLDEAYVEFAGVERSRISLVPTHDNLIVLRSFSKWAGLAGLRVGYGAFPRSLMAHLWKIKQPYNVSVASSAGALAALRAPREEHHIGHIVAERARLVEALEQIPYLEPYPTLANFVLCRVAGRGALELKLELEQAGILVRHFDKPRLWDHIRISVGRPEQTDALFGELRRL